MTSVRLPAFVFLLLVGAACSAQPAPRPATTAPVATASATTPEAPAIPTVSASAPLPAAPAAPAEMFGVWWQATSLKTGSKALEVRFDRDEIAMVDKSGRARVQLATLAASRDGHAEWSHVGEGLSCTLDVTSGSAGFECHEGERGEAFTLVRVKDNIRAEQLDALADAERPRPDECARAERCGPIAMKVLTGKPKFDVDMELGRPRNPTQCRGFNKGIRLLFAEKKKKLPPQCD